MEKEPCAKFCGVLISSHEVMMLQIVPANVQPWFSLHIFKEPFTKFYVCFDHFSWTYEVAKFLMIKLCLDVIDVIHVNEHT